MLDTPTSTVPVSRLLHCACCGSLLGACDSLTSEDLAAEAYELAQARNDGNSTAIEETLMER